LSLASSRDESSSPRGRLPTCVVSIRIIFFHFLKQIPDGLIS
jgi:hypothetical protein